MPSRLLQVFLKSPEPGKVKTRLIPDLGVEEATRIHRALVNHVLDVANKAQVDSIECWVAGDIDHADIRKLAEHFVVCPQQGADLGEKMLHALNHGLKCYDQAAIVGGDAYSLTPDYIDQAFQRLEQNQVVLGPAEDGGYILIAAKQTHDSMFNDIRWGVSSVLQAQLERLHACELSYDLLETRWDIDDIKDIKDHAPQLLS
ncbi:MAG: TIGR04282 family arsenosugar biosynthesis glycosyltransferase [Pseudomonadales bacterium]|nr:TIGR04282 family arsenosugar biosynthesis glycosyltransferase [Pseudomonadales bacterium]